MKKLFALTTLLFLAGATAFARPTSEDRGFRQDRLGGVDGGGGGDAGEDFSFCQPDNCPTYTIQGPTLPIELVDLLVEENQPAEEKNTISL